VLDRRHRLTSSAGFSLATRRGRRAGTRTLVVHAGLAAPDAAPGTEVGFVVSKAVGNAVVRNRVRRRLRHLARERVAAWQGAPVVVVRALAPAADASYASLARDLDTAAHRVGLDAAAGTITERRTLR
jgi:ribonuclease P protein component